MTDHETPTSRPLTDAERADAEATRDDLVEFARKTEEKLRSEGQLSPDWPGTKGKPGEQGKGR
jgi:hypothetical protein